MFEIMKCIAEGIAAHGVKGLMDLVPGGRYVHEIGAYAIKRYREKKNQKKLEDAVKEVIAKKADEALEEAKKAVAEAAPQLADRERELVAQYLASLPEAARQSLKRKEDPTGTTLPAGYTINEPYELAQLLPQHPPRFATGEWVPGREDNWRLERRLGGGGFGEVWLARHSFKRSEKPRAVKFCTDPHARTKLVTHEKQLVVQVMEKSGEHPNIVPLLECHLSGNAPWLMYEYVEGGTLADAILEWLRLAPAERLNRAVATLHLIASAVGHCHALAPAIVHRDLKPANVLMQNGVPRVTDFGIGGTAVDYLIAEEKSRGYESVMGRLPSLLSGSYSLMYSSPQQRNRERPDPRDDVHALGVIAFQMLVGRTDAEVKGNWQKRLKSDGVPEALIDLIGASASDEADDRPRDARLWEAALGKLLPAAANSASDRSSKGPLPGTTAEQTLRLAVPGQWYSRPAGSATVWTEVAQTPASISVQAGTEYSFSVSPRAQNADLAGLACLKELAAFRKLDLWDCEQVTDAGLPHLKELTALQALSLSGCKLLTDAGFVHLQNLTALRVLTLQRCARVTGTGLSNLNRLTALRYLDLSDCTLLTDTGLAHLKDLTSLRALEFQKCALVTEAGLVHLKGLTALESLALAGCTRVTDAGLAHLKGLTALQMLQLSHCERVTDAGLANLKGLTALEVLDLTGCERITDAALAPLGELTGLQSLNLSSCKRLTGAGFAHLKRLSVLRGLSLSRCAQMTDAGLAHLKHLIALRDLDLSGCPLVTDAGLTHLKTISALQGLNLTLCARVTDAAVASLKSALPNCTVHR